jgi:hypothetical protein
MNIPVVLLHVKPLKILMPYMAMDLLPNTLAKIDSNDFVLMMSALKTNLVPEDLLNLMSKH